MHVCLASIFTEGLTYQDNMLAAQNRRDGHEVCIVADCSAYKDGVIVQVAPCDRVMEDGVRLVRLPLMKFAIDGITNRLRYAPGLMRILREFRPDTILYHGVVGLGLVAVGSYKKANPDVKLYLDSHEDFNNSARNWVSKWLQYKLLTRSILSGIRSGVEKVLYVSYESAEFLREMYRLRNDELEFYPLGGVIPSDDQRLSWRSEVRGRLGICDGEIVLVHTGKLDDGKRTGLLLDALSNCTNSSMRLVVAGSLPNTDAGAEISARFDRDDRIKYLGWVSGDELIKILCAGDMYIQPGTQSATLQMAICCGLPVAVYPYRSHEPYVKGNGFYVRNAEDISRVLEVISSRPDELVRMARASREIAGTLLDYKVLAKRLYA